MTDARLIRHCAASRKMSFGLLLFYTLIHLGIFLDGSYAAAASLSQSTLGSVPAGVNAYPISSHRDSDKAVTRAVEAAKNGYAFQAPQYLTIIEPSREAIAGMQAVVTKVRNFISALDPETYASDNATKFSLVIGSFQFSFIFTKGSPHTKTRSLLTLPSQEDLMKQAMFLVAEFFDRGIFTALNIVIFVYKATVLLMIVFALHLIGFQIRPEGLTYHSWNIIN